MIQRITKNTDINFLLDDAKIAEKFIIRFFTTDRTKAIVRTAENVVMEADGKKYIKLPWSTIRLLNNGMLNYEVQNLAVDTDYNDGVFDSTFTAMSKYYIYSDVNDTDTQEIIASNAEKFGQFDNIDAVGIRFSCFVIGQCSLVYARCQRNINLTKIAVLTQFFDFVHSAKPPLMLPIIL